MKSFGVVVAAHRGNPSKGGPSLLAPLISAVIFACAIPAFGQSVEPKAGTWKTWIISSGKDFRVPPPPDAGTTAGELRWLHDAVAEPNPSIADSVSVLERRRAGLPVDGAHQ